MKLICMLVDVMGSSFPVDIEENKLIGHLKKAIKAKKPDTIKCNANKLQLFLAKKDGVWLESETDDAKKLKKGEKTAVIETLTHKDKELQGETGLQKVLMGMPQPSTDQIHVLVLVPSIFSWRAPKPLLSSDGAKWDFQNPLCLDNVAQEIRAHYKAWKRGSMDQTTHPLFLYVNGSGTGKSRLLNEFPNIVKHQIFHDGEDEEMMRLLHNAFTFNVAFGSGTRGSGNFAHPSLAIGARMLYQLQDSMKWGQFLGQTAYHVCPDDVFEKLSQISGKSLHEMCVILCVDGLQHLDHKTESKTSPFHHALNSLCDLVNASKCWVIAIASSMIYQPVREFLLASSQLIIKLPTARLSRPTIHNKDVFQEFGNDALTQLLIDDMGGFGRAIEVLYLVMKRSKGTLDFASILQCVVDAMGEVYPTIEYQINVMQEAFLAVVTRRIVNADSKFGNASLDKVISTGLIRQNKNGFLECSYILYLMLDMDKYSWDEVKGCYTLQRKRENWKPWQDWAQFNCKFRMLKSMAYAQDRSVNWMDVHRGARFGSGCNRTVHEVSRWYTLGPTQMKTKSEGFRRGKCSCNHDSNYPVFLYQPGNSFLCLEDVNNGYFHEVHQCKSIQGTLSLEEFKHEKERAVGKDDLFLLYCTGDVSSDIDDSVLQNCAIVDRSCWEEYYGPFAARAFFMKVIPAPCLNKCSEVELTLVQGIDKACSERIINKRKERLFDDYEDAHERTRIPLPILKRYQLTPPAMNMEE